MQKPEQGSSLFGAILTSNQDDQAVVVPLGGEAQKIISITRNQNKPAPLGEGQNLGVRRIHR